MHTVAVVLIICFSFCFVCCICSSVCVVVAILLICLLGGYNAIKKAVIAVSKEMGLLKKFSDTMSMISGIPGDLSKEKDDFRDLYPDTVNERKSIIDENCSVCDGTRKAKCKDCVQGSKPCKICVSGYIIDRFGSRSIRCYQCSDGSIRCDTCYGDGLIKCTACTDNIENLLL